MLKICGESENANGSDGKKNIEFGDVSLHPRLLFNCLAKVRWL